MDKKLWMLIAHFLINNDEDESQRNLVGRQYIQSTYKQFFIQEKWHNNSTA